MPRLARIARARDARVVRRRVNDAMPHKGLDAYAQAIGWTVEARECESGERELLVTRRRHHGRLTDGCGAPGGSMS